MAATCVSLLVLFLFFVVTVSGTPRIFVDHWTHEQTVFNLIYSIWINIFDCNRPTYCALAQPAFHRHQASICQRPSQMAGDPIGDMVNEMNRALGHLCAHIG